MSESPTTDASSDGIEEEWREAVRSLLRAELKRQNLTYEDVAQRLRSIGVNETAVSVRNKISRGTFPATFFVQFLKVLDVQLIPFRPDASFTGQTPPEVLLMMQGLRWPSKKG